MKIKQQSNPFFQTLSVTIRIATSLTPELKLTSIATSTYHLFCSCHVQRFFIHFVVKFTKWQDKVFVSLNLLVSPKLFLEAPSRLPSPQNFEFERGALSNLVIRKAFPIGLYSTALCFHLHENLGDLNRLTISFVFHMWIKRSESIWKMSPKNIIS